MIRFCEWPAFPFKSSFAWNDECSRSNLRFACVVRLLVVVCKSLSLANVAAQPYVRYTSTSQHLAGRADRTFWLVLMRRFQLQAGNRLMWNTTVSAIQWHGGLTNCGWPRLFLQTQLLARAHAALPDSCWNPCFMRLMFTNRSLFLLPSNRQNRAFTRNTTNRAAEQRFWLCAQAVCCSPHDCVVSLLWPLKHKNHACRHACEFDRRHPTSRILGTWAGASSIATLVPALSIRQGRQVANFGGLAWDPILIGNAT
jgi:hypothetical protein